MSAESKTLEALLGSRKLKARFELIGLGKRQAPKIPTRYPIYFTAQIPLQWQFKSLLKRRWDRTASKYNILDSSFPSAVRFRQVCGSAQQRAKRTNQRWPTSTGDPRLSSAPPQIGVRWQAGGWSHFASLDSLTAMVTITPSGDHSYLIDPPSCPSMLRRINLLP